ncbi:hypothetical protein AURDEDRAFT_153771 [Auricularia subglabra TFB-10046 SS5]|uniref:Zn(2)-C6 fungal-type domain-containing protein n=1 Tax=Auricularia subglabra (strain TFB-10046 / SS5) TaxID=717982 RepID=J0WVV0_AURST|nr:hypothetical protein AURDEDRAFT_153771 [Auricularia subglabra TFB-10046 SS5]
MDPGTAQRRLLACAECKRLKLRCDKKVPCGSCTRRRCESVCPDGTLNKGRGQGNRLLLAESRQLHDKIEAMQKRMAALKQAISELQGPSTDADPEQQHSDKDSTPSGSEDVALASLMGTLTLGEQPQFFGRNAASDYLVFMKGVHDTSISKVSSVSRLSADIMSRCPLWPGTRQRQFLSMLSALPPKNLVYTAVDVYYDNIEWMFGSLMSREELQRDILDVLYADTMPDIDRIHMHDFAIIFNILAAVCMTDPNTEPSPERSRQYCALACVALSTDPVLEHPSLQAIHAIHLLTWLMHVADDQNTVTIGYNLQGLNTQLCKSLGLHKDDAGWALDDKERQRRRSLVWDVALYNCHVAESLGRPPNFALSQFDARLPADTTAYLDDDHHWQQSYTGWSRSFTSACLMRVLEQAHGAAEVSHATVMRLDRMVREHPVSPALRISKPGTVNPDVPMKTAMQQATVMVLAQKLLLFLHRSFFARALSENPEDPLQSNFHGSVLAAFRAAFYITTTVRTLHQQTPFCVRFPFLWSAAFSSCVILGSIVIRSPRCSLAASAWVEFAKTMATFEQVAPNLRSVARVIPHLRRLHQKALSSRENAASESEDTKPSAEDLDAAELAFIYGVTRLSAGVKSKCSSGAIAIEHILSSERPPAGPTYLSYLVPQAFAKFDDPVPADDANSATPSGDSLCASSDSHHADSTWSGFMDDMGLSLFVSQ